MLLILMYHRVHGVGDDPAAFRRHLRHLKAHHPVVWPGEPLPRGALSVCLTFDDATSDFYFEVFPLLQELDLKALVAVPTRYIEPSTEATREARLEAQGRASLSGDYAVQGSPLCSWAELREMQRSGRVQCVSHGHSHADMCDPATELEQELELSQRQLAEGVGEPPGTFVFPYGNTDREVNRRVAARYRYAMRIGSAVNHGWDGNGGLLYRVDAERFWPQRPFLTPAELLRYRLKYYGNRLRGK